MELELLIPFQNGRNSLSYLLKRPKSEFVVNHVINVVVVEQFNKHKGSGGGRQKHKRKEMDSDEEELESPSPPRKATTSSSHRRKALVYDSDED